MKLRIISKGGPGSGHHGHEGRPGEVGGSLPEGAVKFIPAKAPTQQEVELADSSADFTDDTIYTIETAFNIIGVEIGEEGLSPHALTDLTDVEYAQALKDNIVSTLSERTGLSYDSVNEFIAQWAATSNKGYDSLSIQEAFAEELGLELSKWQKELIQPYNKENAEWKRLHDLYDEAYNFRDKAITEYKLAHGMELDAPLLRDANLEMIRATNEEWKKVYPNAPRLSNILTVSNLPPYQPLLPKEDLKKLAREMYNLTQERLADAPDELLLYRGVIMEGGGKGKENSTMKYKGNVIESWSVEPAVAASFASHSEPGSYSMVVAMKVPKTSIVGSCFSGFGCFQELEYVIADNISGSKAFVVHDSRSAVEDALPPYEEDLYFEDIPPEYQQDHLAWADDPDA